jgi:ribosomal protein S18 acetylase RimI-like enzyme
MAELLVELIPDKKAKAHHLLVKTDVGFLVGVVADSDVIAKQFGKKTNPARWKLLKSLEAPIAWLDEMKVAREERGRGIGSELMKTALDVLVENGVRYAVLSPRPERPDDLERLLRFYEGFGFQEVREFEGEPLWSPLMVLDLGSQNT